MAFYGEIKLPGGSHHLAWASQPIPHSLPAQMTASAAELIISYLIDYGHGVCLLALSFLTQP